MVKWLSWMRRIRMAGSDHGSHRCARIQWEVRNRPPSMEIETEKNLFKFVTRESASQRQSVSFIKKNLRAEETILNEIMVRGAHTRQHLTARTFQPFIHSQKLIFRFIKLLWDRSWPVAIAPGLVLFIGLVLSHFRNCLWRLWTHAAVDF